MQGRHQGEQKVCEIPNVPLLGARGPRCCGQEKLCDHGLMEGPSWGELPSASSPG